MKKDIIIKRICKQLEKVWLKHPDQRLGQLLENHIFKSGKYRGIATCFLFYQEDDKTEKILGELLK